MDHDALKSFRAFHRTLSSITETELWRNNGLTAGFFASFGPGIRVHRKDWPALTELRSLAMDFRKLIANDELSNLNLVHNLAFKNKATAGWSPQDLAAIADARSRFNGALDQRADYYSAPEGADEPTVRLLLDGWFNGDWFHGDEHKRAVRTQYELAEGEDLSLALIIPAMRVAVEAAIALDAALRSSPVVGAML